MTLHQKSKNCTDVPPFLIENLFFRHAALVTTAANHCRQILVIAMSFVAKIMKKDRKQKMPEKDPSNYTLLTYLWIFLLSAWGGLVSFIAKVKTGDARCFNFAELIGELVTAAFTGMLTFWFCELANLQPLLTAAFVGISGHMGSRLIFKFEKVLERKFNVIDTPSGKGE